MLITSPCLNGAAAPTFLLSPTTVLELLGLIEQGAALIEAKHYKQAGLCLTQALQRNKDMLVLESMEETPGEGFKDRHIKTHHDHETGEEEQEDDHGDDDDGHDDEVSSSSYLCHQVLELAIGATSKNCDIVVEDRFFTNKKDKNACHDDCRRSMYAHAAPLVLMQCDQLFDLMARIPIQEFQLTLSLIIIYNLALSQHLYGICQMKKGFSSYSTLFDRAFSLYRYSYTLLHQLKLETCWFLGLAIVNNEAQILSILGKHQEAEERLQAILSGICCLNLYFADNQEGFLPRSFLEGLVHNISHLILKEAATASAA